MTNTKYSGRELRQELSITHPLVTVNATQIAQEELGLPITNTTMLGALLKAREIVPVQALIGPLENRFGRIAAKNIKAFQRAYAEAEIDLP